MGVIRAVDALLRPMRRERLIVSWNLAARGITLAATSLLVTAIAFTLG
jgi:hypothetical protein